MLKKGELIKGWYEILEHLFSNGKWDVYRAKDVEDGKIWAVRVPDDRIIKL